MVVTVHGRRAVASSTNPGRLRWRRLGLLCYGNSELDNLFLDTRNVCTHLLHLVYCVVVVWVEILHACDLRLYCADSVVEPLKFASDVGHLVRAGGR